MKSNEELQLESKVSDILLDLVQQDLYNDLTTNDLQGVCQFKAMEIIKMVREAS